MREPVQLLKPRETPKDFEFFENSQPPVQADMLVQGLAGAEGGIDAKINQHWSVSASGAWSRGEAFHSYDSVDAGFLVSYLRETRAVRRDGVESASVSYPMRFSFGVQQQTFYDFPGHSHVSVVPVVKFTLF